MKELYQQECWPFFCIAIRHSTHFLSYYPPSSVRLLYALLIHLGCLHSLHPMQRLLKLVNIFICICILVLYISLSFTSVIIGIYNHNLQNQCLGKNVQYFPHLTFCPSLATTNHFMISVVLCLLTCTIPFAVFQTGFFYLSMCI